MINNIPLKILKLKNIKLRIQRLKIIQKARVIKNICKDIFRCRTKSKQLPKVGIQSHGALKKMSKQILLKLQMNPVNQIKLKMMEKTWVRRIWKKGYRIIYCKLAKEKNSRENIKFLKIT